MSDPTPGARPDERKLPEKLDDLQAAHPFPYNLAVGVIVALVGVLLGFHWIVVPLYSISYACIRTYLWGEGRVLRRQYEVRKVRAAQERNRRRA